MKDKKLLALVRRAIKKDQQAFEALCELKAREIIFLCARELGNPQDGEDAAQEVLIRMQKHIENLQAPEAFNVWLNRIIVTTCSNMRRNNMRHQNALPIEYFDDVLMDDTLGGLPQEYAEDADKRRRVVQMIDELPEKYRTCVLLHYYQRMDYNEIAEVTGTSRNAVDNNLRMARKILNLELENEFGAESLNPKGVPLVPVSAVLFTVMSKSAEATIPASAVAACLKASGVYTAFTAGASAAGSAISGITSKLALKVVAAVATVAVVGGGAWLAVNRLAPTATPPPAVVEPGNIAQAALPVGKQSIRGHVALENTALDPDAFNGLDGLVMELVQEGKPDEVLQTVETRGGAEGGAFAFTALAPGNYQIRLLLPNNDAALAALAAAEAAEGATTLKMTTKTDGQPAAWLCQNGSTLYKVKEDGDIDGLFLELPLPAIVSGHLEAQDDIVDAGLLEGIEMELWDPQGRLIATTSTDEAGTYRFEDAMVSQRGTYTLRLLENEGMRVTLATTELELELYPGTGYGGLPQLTER